MKSLFFVNNKIIKFYFKQIIGLINLLLYPIAIIPWSIGRIIESRISLGRISRYLQRKDIDPKAVFRGDSESKIAIEISNMRLSWPKAAISNTKGSTSEKYNQVEPLDQNEEEKDMLKQKLLDYNESSSDFVNKTNFGLIIKELLVEKGKLYFLLGRVGAGKSALLQAILNEIDITPMELMGSDIFSSFQSTNTMRNTALEAQSFKMSTISDRKILVNGKVAYVSQNNWLQDLTIRVKIYSKIYKNNFDIIKLLWLSLIKRDLA